MDEEQRPGIRHRLARGLAAGIAGTAALALSDACERRLLGREPVYSYALIGRRLARRYLAGANREQGARLGLALRWLYGPSLGAAYGGLRPLFARLGPVAPLLMSAGIAASELVFFPIVGATPPVEQWPRRQRWVLPLHSTVFAAVTAVIYASLSHDTTHGATGRPGASGSSSP